MVGVENRHYEDKGDVFAESSWSDVVKKKCYQVSPKQEIFIFKMNNVIHRSIILFIDGLAGSLPKYGLKTIWWAINNAIGRRTVVVVYSSSASGEKRRHFDWNPRSASLSPEY